MQEKILAQHRCSQGEQIAYSPRGETIGLTQAAGKLHRFMLKEQAKEGMAFVELRERE